MAVLSLRPPPGAGWETVKCEHTVPAGAQRAGGAELLPASRPRDLRQLHAVPALHLPGLHARPRRSATSASSASDEGAKSVRKPKTHRRRQARSSRTC